MTEPGSTLRRVTLSWAQSLDGCIAARKDSRLRISGEESMRVTHRMRAEHDAILVGIGTVLADDPKLTVRLVEGLSPQPVIVDASLRLPEDCRLMQRTDRRPWIFCSRQAAPERISRLESLGARVFVTACTDEGRVDLRSILEKLASEGVGSLMVEGGGQILASFMRERLADGVSITIGPSFVGGYNPFVAPEQIPTFGLPFRICDACVELHGQDMVLSGRPVW